LVAETREDGNSVASVAFPDLAVPPRFFGRREGRAGSGSTTSAATIGSFAVSAGKASTPAVSFFRQS
jgi:hypothetical protein